MKTLNEVRNRIKTETYDSAISILSEFIDRNPENDEALTLRGLKHWGAGKRALAINDYLAAIAINPDSKAVEALSAANGILDYRNKDLYNP